MMNTIKICCDTRRTPLVTRAEEILARTLNERSGVEQRKEDADHTVTLAVRDGIGTEGFTIAGNGGNTAITGNDERGLLYGVGKFLRSCRFSDDGFEPGKWRGTSVPVKPVRGMYFASHFHNFYNDAPVEAVERYVEEMALWGCNALSVWFDMHHYSGMDDPDAREMVDRLRVILKAAERVGVGLALTSLSNEAFSSSPMEMRAEWEVQNGYHRSPGGHYHVEICPNKPGGMEKILEYRREMLEVFKDLNIEYVWTWPYDQGGCTCRDCTPWGTNGYVKTAEAEVAVIKEFFPEAKIVFSTWYFDHFVPGEWEGLDKAFAAKKPDWIDFMMIDDHSGFPEYPIQHGVPGGFPVLGFPEISMARMGPWGGFGANPRPRYWQNHWNKVRDMMSGSFPYSEGIYEDINKVLEFQFGWDPDRSSKEIVSEYINYEYSPDVLDDTLRMIDILEDSMRHGINREVMKKIMKSGSQVGAGQMGDSDRSGTDVLYVLPELKNPGECLELATGIDARLGRAARKAWRWRILWLRAALDKELHDSGGCPTEHSEAYFDELTAIYHAQNAEASVAPPGLKSLKRLA